jgi:iron complex transport system substrate-binding protein
MRGVILWLCLLLAAGAQERIVTLSPSLSEIVFGLGHGQELVGVSSFAAWPEEVKNIEKIGGYFAPDLEKILALRPTLVIGQEHHAALLAKLRALGLQTLQVNLNRIEGIEQGITTIADAIHADNAGELVGAIEQARKEAPKLKQPRSVLIVFGLTYDLRDRIFAAGHNLYFEQIIETCGATNAYTADDTGQPVLSYEGLIALDPDVIILLHSEQTDAPADPKQLRHSWYALPVKAARNGRIYIADAGLIAIPSHRVAESIKTLCEVITRD